MASLWIEFVWLHVLVLTVRFCGAAASTRLAFASNLDTEVVRRVYRWEWDFPGIGSGTFTNYSFVLRTGKRKWSLPGFGSGSFTILSCRFNWKLILSFPWFGLALETQLCFPRFGLVRKMWPVRLPFHPFDRAMYCVLLSLHWWLQNGVNECVLFFALPSAMAICFESCLTCSVEIYTPTIHLILFFYIMSMSLVYCGQSK